jgi:REP element-mobilizing transposase RayT
MLRGIEKRGIVTDDQDREEFVSRMGSAASATGTAIFAWALLPNHAHILLRSGPGGLPKFMMRLLTGYAIRFNRRHHRHGHLFQNRYKSIVCEEDAYFQELLRYIHLNPLRANLVTSLRALDLYPWCGHTVLVGKGVRAWQDKRYALSWFGQREREAVKRYREYVAQGVALGRRPELVGGGLVRSRGGWSQVRSLRAIGIRVRADERILGSGEFVERLVAEAADRVQMQIPAGRRAAQVRETVERWCAAHGVSVAEVRGGGRRASVSRVRGMLAHHMVSVLGVPLAETARHLGVTTSAISRALERGVGGQEIS